MKKIFIFLSTISLFCFAQASEHPIIDAYTAAITQALTRGSIVTSNHVGHFDNLIKGTDKLVVVKFYAPWCSSCRKIDKHFVAFSKQYVGKSLFLSVNIDKHRGLLNRYKIKRIPTFMFFRNGQMIKRVLDPNPGQLNNLIADLTK